MQFCDGLTSKENSLDRIWKGRYNEYIKVPERKEKGLKWTIQLIMYKKGKIVSI